MVQLEEGEIYRIRYLLRAQGGNAEPREGVMQFDHGIPILRHSNLVGRIEPFAIDPAQLTPSDDPDVDFIYLGPPLEASI
jgi:hypothetical protein